MVLMNLSQGRNRDTVWKVGLRTQWGQERVGAWREQPLAHIRLRESATGSSRASSPP